MVLAQYGSEWFLSFLISTSDLERQDNEYIEKAHPWVKL